MLKILDPTTFPIDISPCPLKAALTLTTNSGALVPKATTVSPITSGDIFARTAREELPRTSQSAPIYNAIKDRISNVMFVAM